MTERTSASAAAIAAATPADRERFVDLLRAVSIGVVVFGHWLLAIVTWHEGKVAGENALSVLPYTRMLTWVLQVMPLFFFVGGFANAVTWHRRREQGYATFLRTRFVRMLRPTIVLAAAWLFMARVMVMAGVPSEQVHTMASLVAKPLWFLAVYLVLVAVVPPMLSLHDRYRLRVPIVLLAGAIAVDVVRRAFDLEIVGWANFAFVWLIPHQLGFFYADGSLVRIGRRAHALLALFGLGAMIALTATGLYPPSMVGVPGADASNNDPPTVALVALSVWLIGLAMLWRPAATRWLERPRVWANVVRINTVIMTAFLWHQTALLLGAMVALPLGFPQPEAGTAVWWLTRPLWLAVLCLVLAPFVMTFGRFEAGKPDTAAIPAWRTYAGVALASAGMIGCAQAGFAPGAKGADLPIGPAVAAVFLFGGAFALRVHRKLFTLNRSDFANAS